MHGGDNGQRAQNRNKQDKKIHSSNISKFGEERRRIQCYCFNMILNTNPRLSDSCLRAGSS